MAKVNLCGKESGNIWIRKPTRVSSDGLLFEINNTKVGLTSHGRHLQFTRVAFGCHGNWFVSGDQQGNIYQFNMAKNRFKLVHRTGQACTALACCISRPSEVLVALADYSIKCVDIESGELVATLRGHEASVKSISLHSSGRFALAVSSRDSVLWDLDSFARCRTLNGGQEVGVQEVLFQPMSNTILTCFKDDSIHAWEADSMEYKYQIQPPFGPTPHYRSLASPRDGRLLVAGGRSGFLHVWSSEGRQLLRIVQLPSKIRVVRQLLFLPDNFDGGSSETLGFLAQDGIMRFINIHSCKLLFQIGSHDQMLSSAQVSPDGHYIAAVSELGNILVYEVGTLAKDLHQPPAPLMRLMDDEVEEQDTSSKTPKVSKMTYSRPQTRGKRASFSHKSTRLTPRLQAGSEGESGRDGEGAKGEDRGKMALDVDKLKSILKGYGEYPAKYRMFIWRRLLQLPENYAAYSALLDKATHPAFTTLHQDCPLKSRKLLRVLQRALSCLAHWSSIFGETSYLPGLVFPFVKLFQNNQLVAFEILATLLMNWCGHWFDYFPNPPLNVLAMVENCLAHHDAALLQHFITHNITSHHYAWPLLETLFSEVLSREEWLRLWDNLISAHPGFLLLAVVAYLTTARHTLLQCSSQEDFEYFFHHRSSLGMGAVVQEAYRLQQTTPPKLHPEKILEPFVPLTKGSYPVFNKYPKFIVDYQVRERERIRQEELQYLRERQSALELERMAEQRRHEEEAWLRQQQLLLEAEEQRRRMIQVEEGKLSDQRARLQAMKRELKVKELRALDAARRKFLGHQQAVQEAELHRLDDQLQRRVQQREVETRTAIEDLEVRALELERQRAQVEHELARANQEVLYGLRVDHEAQLHSESLERSALEKAVEEEGERERQRVGAAHTRLARVQAERANLRTLQQAGAKREWHEAHREGQTEEVMDRARQQRLREHRLAGLVEGLEKEHQSQLATEAEHLSSQCLGYPLDGGQRKEGILGEIPSTEGVEGAAPTSEQSVVRVSQDTPGASGLQWCRRREALDQQESELLARVRELRHRVVGQMSTKKTTPLTQTTTIS